MDTLYSLIDAMLIIITSGAGVKIASHLLGMLFNIEEKETYVKKIKNCIIAIIISSSIFSIKAIIEYYFK